MANVRLENDDIERTKKSATQVKWLPCIGNSILARETANRRYSGPIQSDLEDFRRFDLWVSCRYLPWVRTA